MLETLRRILESCSVHYLALVAKELGLSVADLPSGDASPAQKAAWLLTAAGAERGQLSRIAQAMRDAGLYVPDTPEPLGKGTVIAAIVAAPEMNPEASALSAWLRKLRDQIARIRRVDPGSPDARELLDGADLVVVLLGASTSGPEGAALLGEVLDRAISACLNPIPNERWRRYRAEMMDAMDLHERAALRFSPTDLLPTLQDPIHRRLRELCPPDKGGPAMLEDWERHMLQQQMEAWRKGRAGALSGIDRRAGQDGRVRLERASLYVSLHAGPGRWGRDEADAVVITDERAAEEPSDRGERKPVFLDELIAHPDLPHLVIIGEAGSGKSVLLQHVAWTLACHHLHEPLPEAARLDALWADAALAPIPVLVEARQLASRKGAACIDTLLCEELGCDRVTLRPLLEQGRYLLLVDSLDEVPTQAGRERVVAALAGLSRRSRCRVVLTTRPSAHTRVSMPQGFAYVRIAPLDDDRRAALVDRWVTVQALPEATAQRLRDALAGLTERFPAAPDDRSPLENPLLLTCVMIVFLSQKRLPDNTADLYGAMVKLLVYSRVEEDVRKEDQDRSAAAWRELLEEIAWLMQSAGTTAMPVRALVDALLRARRQRQPQERRAPQDRARDADEMREQVDLLAARTGILRFESREGGPVVRPWHRSFQEYLAARRLAHRRGDEGKRIRALASGLLFDPGWEGALRFAVGAFGQTGSDKARAVVETLVAMAEADPHPKREGRLLGLASAGLAEYQREYFEGHALLKTLPQTIAGRFAAQGADWPWKDRLLALEALGVLGDPRLAVPTTEGWGEVPAGTYAIGGDREAWQSLPAQRVTLDRFLLRSWPVTVGEYAAFVEAGGYRADTWWDPEAEPPPGPGGWSTQHRHKNRPVTGVSWWEARAFCRWAQKTWTVPEGGVLDLPTSQEWEAAARLTRGGPFPWGKDEPGREDAARANHVWRGEPPRHPTPVGMFPKGDAGPWVDLAGNVWEWCASILDRGQHRDCRIVDSCRQGDTSGAPRVLRGGSWDDLPWRLRYASRLGIVPEIQLRYVGFRPCVCFPPQHAL
ncbi:MAG: SUMF1/EgtB/PvdO family nonheme iron enzyme [Alphaproteobacteria bacterium]|nr:SUMF1/EgtB/PvdO family nonheme iron enzyme [Alphaproteobacteria bacterium]